MSVIEKSYQSLAERIIANPGSKLAPEDDDIVSRFFALWRQRAAYRSAPDNPIPLNGVEGSALTKDQEEILESRWIGYVRAEGVPARQIYGLNIQRNVDVLMLALRERRWGVLALNEGELIVPDVPERFFVPVTPSLCLAWGYDSGQISGADASLLNRTFVSGCQNYWFCRTLPSYRLNTG